MIGIIGAMEEEISVILSEMSNVTVEKHFNKTFYIANYKNINVVIVESGIGMVNSSITTTLLKSIFNVDKVIFSGVAGSTSKNVKALDIVVGNSFVEYMFDVTKAGNYVKGQIAGTKKRNLDANENLIKLTFDIDTKVDKHYGTIASGDVFVNSIEDKLKINKEFDAIAVDMESAAVAHTCINLNIPFLILRSISDSLVENSEIEFNELIYLASRNSKNFLIKLLEKLNKNE